MCVSIVSSKASCIILSEQAKMMFHGFFLIPLSNLHPSYRFIIYYTVLPLKHCIVAQLYQFIQFLPRVQHRSHQGCSSSFFSIHPSGFSSPHRSLFDSASICLPFRLIMSYLCFRQHPVSATLALQIPIPMMSMMIMVF